MKVKDYRMKKIVFLVSTLLISHTLMAADQKDITADNAVDQCLDKYHDVPVLSRYA